jgi:hypothetical protein
MRLAFALLALAALPLVPSCTSEAAGPAGVYAVSIDTTGKPEDQVKVMQSMMKPGDCTLTADGKFDSSMEIMGKKTTIKGTWKLDGNKITMTSTEEDGQKKNGETVTGTYKPGEIMVEMKDEKSPQPIKMIMKLK